MDDVEERHVAMWDVSLFVLTPCMFLPLFHIFIRTYGNFSHKTGSNILLQKLKIIHYFKDPENLKRKYKMAQMPIDPKHITTTNRFRLTKIPTELEVHLTFFF